VRPARKPASQSLLRNCSMGTCWFAATRKDAGERSTKKRPLPDSYESFFGPATEQMVAVPGLYPPAGLDATSRVKLDRYLLRKIASDERRKRPLCTYMPAAKLKYSKDCPLQIKAIYHNMLDFRGF
jgi:hypothetical protein